MNSRMRQLVIERDGRVCVFCKGECPFQKTDRCNLPAKTLNDKAYWKLDSLRSSLGRLQVDHVHGKRRESWNEVVTLCPCCHSKKVQGGGDVFNAEVAYLATLGAPPDEYVTEQLKEAKAKPVRKAKKKAAQKAAYQKTTKKYGKPTIPSAPMRATPKEASAPKPKKTKGESKWANLPIHPTYLK